MSQSIYSLIEDINYEWMKEADRYGNESRGKWGWYTDIAEISFSLPFHRTLLGRDHTYFVLDLDPEIVSYPDMESIKEDPLKHRELCIRTIIDFTKGFIREHIPHKFFGKLSGKGIHLIQRVPERMDKRRFRSVIRHLCKPCSHEGDENHVCTHLCDGWNFPKRWSNDKQRWIKNKTQWSKLYLHEETGAVLRVSIDLNMFKTGRHMIRWTYSRNQKVIQLYNYSIPIDFWDSDWIIQNMTRRGLEVYPPHRYEIPPFSFYEQLTPESQLREPMFDETTSGRPGVRDLTYSINVPDVGTELTEFQLAKIEEMKGFFTGEIEETPPCVRQHYENAISLAGLFWPRVVLVRYLSGKGYSPDSVALFFRFHINDEEDNSTSNRGKLVINLKRAYGSLQQPDMVPGCRKMREHEDFGVVDSSICELCRRTYPLAKHPGLESIEEQKDRGWGRIQTLCRDILLGGDSVVIKKATRAGVTTSLIAMTKLVAKKMLVVTPTNRIGEKTIPNALKIAKESLGIDVRGAMFAANKKSCLKLVYLNKNIEHRKSEEPDWGDRSIAYNKLHYNNRPDCVGCVFRHRHFPLLRHHGNDPNSYPIPVLHAEMDNWGPYVPEEDIEGNCAYVTIRDHLRNIDVMFTTYSKLTALMQNNTEDAQLIKEAIADHFDVILLDEVSYLTNQSPLVVPILQKSAKVREDDTREYTINIFEDLVRETALLHTLIETETTNEAIGFIRQFTESQQLLRIDPPTEYMTRRVENKDNQIIMEQDRERLEAHFAAFHSLIETAAREYNIHLEKTEDILHLLNTNNWIIVSIPTVFHPVDVSIVAEPDVSYLRRFLRFFNTDGKQILVTDATLPYIDVGGFLGINLGETEIGDPRETNDHQLVITDSRRMSVIDLFFGKRAEKTQEELLSFINLVCDTHGRENIIIIVPNIWSNIKLREYMMQGKIPSCDMTWYRSDRTVGVECDKRVMICITAPHPPTGAHDWLAMWYQGQGIAREENMTLLGKELSLNSTKAAFYQTIGRAKDPECEERSVVYLWGIAGRKMLSEGEPPGAADLMVFDKTQIPLPHISITTREESRGELAVRMGRAWKEHRIQLNIDQTRIFGKVLKNGVFLTGDTKNRFSFYSRKEVEDVIIRTDPAWFDIFGIEANQIMRGNRKSWELRRKDYIEIPD